MMALLFLIFLAAMTLLWLRRRGLAMLVYVGAMALSVFWYFHHATDSLTLAF
ncbi:MAG: DUF5993 family protein [Sneathiellaceae bacterium]